MPQTTTHENAIDCKVFLDNALGTPVDISGSSNKVEMELENMVGELTTFGSKWKVRKVAGKDGTVDLDVVFSTAADEGFDIIDDWFHGGNDGPRTLRLDVPNSNVGSRRYTGEFVLESYNIPADSEEADPMKVSVSLKPTGAITRTMITS